MVDSDNCPGSIRQILFILSQTFFYPISRSAFISANQRLPNDIFSRQGLSHPELREAGLANRIAATQHCGMRTLAHSKRGSLTLPPELRRKMGLDKLRNPILLVEEREGGVFLHPAVAMPVRDLPKSQIKAWIARDEAEMKAFQAVGKARKK
jgi:bifunctional DNA-binding transcriptional regulator/antitoxin component of YhaV-PrlF toxin-antitoxin module